MPRIQTYQTKDWLIDQYKNQKKTITAIAEEEEVSECTIIYWIKKHGIEKEARPRLPKNKEAAILYKDRDWLFDQYITQTKSSEQIAKEIGIASATTIRQWLVRLNIQIRDSATAISISPSLKRTNKPVDTSHISREWLIENYLTKDLSLRQLSDLSGVARDTLKKVLEAHNIELKPIRADFPYQDKEWLEHRYSVLKLPLEDIAEEADSCISVISQWVRRHQIEKRDNRLPEGEVGLREVYRSYKREAATRNLDFELDLNTFRKLTKQNCFYCNKPPSQIRFQDQNGEYVFNGIDRFQNDVGYTIANCLPACKQCNKAKSDLTSEQFEQWAYELAHNLFVVKNLRNGTNLRLEAKEVLFEDRFEEEY